MVYCSYEKCCVNITSTACFCCDHPDCVISICRNCYNLFDSKCFYHSVNNKIISYDEKMNNSDKKFFNNTHFKNKDDNNNNNNNNNKNKK